MSELADAITKEDRISPAGINKRGPEKDRLTVVLTITHEHYPGKPTQVDSRGCSDIEFKESVVGPRQIHVEHGKFKKLDYAWLAERGMVTVFIKNITAHAKPGESIGLIYVGFEPGQGMIEAVPGGPPQFFRPVKDADVYISSMTGDVDIEYAVFPR